MRVITKERDAFVLKSWNLAKRLFQLKIYANAEAMKMYKYYTTHKIK